MNNWKQWITSHLIWIYPLLALLIYWPSRYAGFVHDFTGWYERYHTYGTDGIWHCFGYHRLQHVMHFFHFWIYRVFDTSPLPWYIIYSALFGLNAYLVYWLTKKLIRYFHVEDGWIPLIASFLFLIHPYQATAVVWKVCFHYLLATAILLYSLGRVIQWISSARNTYNGKNLLELGGLHVLFAISLFVHELTISLPLFCLLLLGLLIRNRKEKWKSMLTLILLPQLVIIFIYFNLTSTLLLDQGKEQLLSEHQFDLKKQSAAIAQYSTKHILFSRYWTHIDKQDWQQFWQKEIVAIGFVVCGLLMTFLFYFYYIKIPPKLKLIAFCLLAFVSAIGPFTSAYVHYILYGTNDMYGFSASAFLMIALTSACRFMLLRLGQVVLCLYAILSMVFLSNTIYYWQQSAYVMNSLLDDFRWYDNRKVYVLAGPDNFQGVLMMKPGGSSMLDDHLFVRNGAYPKCDIEDVMLFNMTNRNDGVSIIVHTKDSLSVKFNQWGTWHWRNGIGATSYETDDFEVRLAIPYYHLKRKRSVKDAVYIYQDGAKWHEVEEWTSE